MLYVWVFGCVALLHFFITLCSNFFLGFFFAFARLSNLLGNYFRCFSCALGINWDFMFLVHFYCFDFCNFTEAFFQLMGNWNGQSQFCCDIDFYCSQTPHSTFPLKTKLHKCQWNLNGFCNTPISQKVGLQLLFITQNPIEIQIKAINSALLSLLNFTHISHSALFTISWYCNLAKKHLPSKLLNYRKNSAFDLDNFFFHFALCKTFFMLFCATLEKKFFFEHFWIV